MRLSAERCGFARPVTDKVKPSGKKNGAGAAADANVTSVVRSSLLKIEVN